MTRTLKMQTVWMAGLVLATFTAQAQPQTSASTQTPTPVAAQEKAAVVAPAAGAPSAPGVVTAANTEPRYAASDLARAFSYMDGNRDGKVSRDEAAGFRNVAKHFDAADTNHDQSLSLDEFSSAMNRSRKP